MAVGYKDWSVPFSYVGGNLHTSVGTVTCPALTPTDLVSIIGKGKVIGGIVVTDAAISHRYDAVSIWTEGVQYASAVFSKLFKYGVTESNIDDVALLVYNDIDFLYTIKLPNTVFFNRSFKIVYTNMTLTTVDVDLYLYYSSL